MKDDDPAPMSDDDPAPMNDDDPAPMKDDEPAPMKDDDDPAPMSDDQPAPMNDDEFDTALVTAAFRLGAEDGWRNVNPGAAARAAGLPLARARVRFPSRASILVRFGRLADRAALSDAPDEGPVRDRLFDLLMRRIDVLQANRAGVKALLRTLPADPSMAMLMASANQTSMRWMLQGAGINPTGPRGELQVRGLLAVWLWAVRAWDRDESEDLSTTMAAIDTALLRAERLAAWLHGTRSAAAPPPIAGGAGESDAASTATRARVAPATVSDAAGTGTGSAGPGSTPPTLPPPEPKLLPGDEA